MDESHATNAESNLALAARQSHGPRAGRVLLADGNRLTQRIAAHLLQTDGHNVTTVCTGEQLLASLRHSTFDLLLMDMEMLDVTVGEAVAMVREQEISTKGHLSLVAMTSSPLQGERCLQVGMDQYIVKPLTLDEIRRVIAAHLPPANPEFTFDYAAALSRVNGDQAFLCTLATMFVEDSPSQLEEVRVAVELHDGVRLSRAAHKLKGSAFPFGAAKLCKSAQTLESIGESGQPADAMDEYRRCETECGRLLRDLAAMLSGVDAQRDQSPSSVAGPEGTVPCTA
jgi:two-component system sensor histidine kinase/response regulator